VESIGLFEAKTHLSELIARAERGEEVIITRHNKPAAKLVPIGRALADNSQRRRAALDALQAFDAIALPGVDLAELITTGRR
jgi:prevent-host-death family protein